MKQTQGRGAQSHSKSHGVCSVTCILTIYIYIFFFCITVFCKQKKFNFEIIFVPIVENDFGYFVVNDIKWHLWLNVYFVKELH